MATADGIVELDGHPIDKARLADPCERYGVAELSVFGSVARGEASSGSDLDLLYVLRPGRSLGSAINRLEDELAELFGRPRVQEGPAPNDPRRRSGRGPPAVCSVIRCCWPR